MRSEEGSSWGSKKRKNRVETLVDGMHSATLLLGEKFENALKDMVEMVRMEMEKDIQNKTSKVNSELVKMQSLSRVERFTAVQKITSEPNNVLIFWSLDASEREHWVRFILQSWCSLWFENFDLGFGRYVVYSFRGNLILCSELISGFRNVRYVVNSFKCYRMLVMEFRLSLSSFIRWFISYKHLGTSHGLCLIRYRMLGWCLVMIQLLFGYR